MLARQPFDKYERSAANWGEVECIVTHREDSVHRNDGLCLSTETGCKWRVLRLGDDIDGVLINNDCL